MIALFLGSVGVNANADNQKGKDALKSGDYATALRELKPLAEHGDVDAQYYLAWMYVSGKGVPQDYETGIKLLKLAAENGNHYAQYDLGGLYNKGKGVKRDRKAGAKWIKLSAEQGYNWAQLAMATIYKDGRGVIQDNIYAHMWGNIAASNGLAYAGEIRDEVADRMHHSEIAEAQKLARECVRKNYKGC